MISKKKSPSKIKYNYEKDTIHKSSIYIYILSFNVNVNNFGTWKKKSKPLVALLASLVVSSFHLLFNQKNAYYTQKNLCFFSLSLALIIRWTKEKQANDKLFIVQGTSKEKSAKHTIYHVNPKKGE